jgi:secernin
MCDTFVVMPPNTENGDVLLAKISDMDVNVGYGLRNLPRKTHAPGELLRTTHICIPQTETTYDTTTCGYDFVWGIEMGINEYGFAIGDEAQNTKEMLTEKRDGIISMDFNRIALERARNCREAISIITLLLEEYGQGGNCSLYGNFHMDGSYLMADPNETWILQTAGRKWSARRVKGFDSLSNCLRSTKGWEMSSEEQLEMVSMNQDRAFLFGQPRQEVTHSYVESARKPFRLKNAFELLRYHNENFDVENQPDFPGYICLHGFAAQNGSSIGGNSAWVGQLNPEDGNMGWFTVTAGTCLSIFKPVYPGVALANIVGPLPSNVFDPNTLWWKHELLHRRVLADFNKLMPLIRKDFDNIEAEFLEEAPRYRKSSMDEKRKYMKYCFSKAQQAENAWIADLSRRSFSFRNPRYGEYWKRYNQEAGIMGMPT